MNEKPILIALDNDPETVRQLFRLLGDRFQIRATADLACAIKWLTKEQNIVAFMACDAWNNNAGVDALESARLERSEVTRILIATYNCLENIVRGLHVGSFAQTISKPLQKVEILAVLSARAPAQSPVIEGTPSSVSTMA